MNVNRCGASTLEAIVARCQGNWGVDERDVRLRERLRKRAVNVEEAASDRELRDLHRLCELRIVDRLRELRFIRMRSGSRGARTDESVGP